jgi:hypothetical protein
MEKQPVTAESIARLADQGEDVSSHFTNDGRMMPPLENREVGPSKDAIEELNEKARVDQGMDLLR